jgi:hypothetical protein
VQSTHMLRGYCVSCVVAHSKHGSHEVIAAGIAASSATQRPCCCLLSGKETEPSKHSTVRASTKSSRQYLAIVFFSS